MWFGARAHLLSAPVPSSGFLLHLFCCRYDVARCVCTAMTSHRPRLNSRTSLHLYMELKYNRSFKQKIPELPWTGDVYFCTNCCQPVSRKSGAASLWPRSSSRLCLLLFQNQASNQWNASCSQFYQKTNIFTGIKRTYWKLQWSSLIKA